MSHDTAQLLEDIRQLRMLAFHQHGGSGHLLYGDDGCMDCNTCGCDFRNDTPQELRDKISNYNLQQLARHAAQSTCGCRLAWAPQCGKPQKAEGMGCVCRKCGHVPMCHK